MKKLIITLVIIALTLLGVYTWLGGFTKVTVSEEKAGPFHLLYLDHTGPYQKIGGVLKKVKTLIDENSIKPTAYFGIYYDDPAHVENDKLRSIAGVIVDAAGLQAAQALLKDKKLAQRTIKEQTFVKSDFPYRNMMSVMLAIGKVYPALDKYGKDHGFPDYEYKSTAYENAFIMEIYRETKIDYLMPMPVKK